MSGQSSFPTQQYSLVTDNSEISMNLLSNKKFVSLVSESIEDGVALIDSIIYTDQPAIAPER